MKKKGLVFILDGLGDRPCPQLNGKTPLQAATIPVLDQLALESQCGMMDPLMPGIPVDTHTGVGILFGLPPLQAVHLRRGPIEAAGINLELQHGDIFMRANFACVQKEQGHFRILDRRAGRINEKVEQLCAALKDLEVADGISASLYAATQHRLVLQLRGKGLSAQISDTDPGGNHIELGIRKSVPNPPFEASAQITADALNRFTCMAHDILHDHPVNLDRIEKGKPAANGVIARGAGAYQPMKNLLTHLQLQVATVAGEATVLGLARLFNFHCQSSPRFTSLPDTDLREKLRMAMEVLEHHDLVFVHIKGTDTAAHDKNPLLKSEFISRFDQELGKINLDNTIVGLCADHSTDSVRGEHNGDPVPVLIHNPIGRRDRVGHYNEIDCIAGALGRITAQGFLITLLDAMGVLGNYKPSDMEYYQPRS